MRVNTLLGSTIVLFILALSIASGNIEHSAVKDLTFYVGTYTRGDSEGIYQYQLFPDGTMKSLGLAVKSENPSYLCKSHNGKYLLAVNENRNDSGGGGTISTFSIDSSGLTPIDQKSSGGASPCFVSTNDSSHVLVANYGSGNVSLLKLGPTGMLDGPLDILQHEGQGTSRRQQGPHAHSAWFEKDTNGIITVDLGTNELWFSELDTFKNKLIPKKPYKISMIPGAGPRHLAFHPFNSWIYVINELSSTVTHLTKNSLGEYEINSTHSTLPESYDGANTSADIHISSDGKFLYASNRGHNSIVIYQINQLNGDLSIVAYEGVHGDGPRNFTLSPDESILLVANQKSNNIVSFLRDANNGTLVFKAEIEAPSPVCLLF